MKSKAILLFSVIVLFTLSFTAEAQIFQFSLNGYTSELLGDITNEDFNDPGAAYVAFASGGGIEFKYFTKSNIGLGLRWHATTYIQDQDAYLADLKDELGITDDNYDITEFPVYWSSSTLFTFSYVIGVSKNFYFEPYLGLGVKGFSSTAEHAIYMVDGTTYTYRKDPEGYYGFSYVPGFKFQWNVTKNIGLNLFVEYEGVSLDEGLESSFVHSYNSFESTETPKDYDVQAINWGLGLAFSFGKGLKE